MPERIYERGGELEVQFHFCVRDRILPVWHAGRLRLIHWGTRRGESSHLPITGWTRQTTVESGYWSELNAQQVVIPATMGLDQGIWYRIRQGILAILVRDEAGDPRVYPICEPATHYYQIMTKSDWMPVLVGQRI